MKLLSERRGRVLIMTMSNPEARNAMWPELYPQAAALVREVAADRTIGAIIITGDGEHFCGGGNLSRLLAQRDRPPETQRPNLDAFHDWIAALQECPKPVLAAVEGAAAGGGFSLCLACDLIVAAEDAKFIMSYVKVALSPDGGGSDSLSTMLPHQAAMEFLLDGAPVSAARLHALGVVNRVVPNNTALTECLAWATRLAQGPGGTNARMKQLVHGARGRSRREQLDAERDSFLERLYSEEAGEGIQAFLHKRAPKFT